MSLRLYRRHEKRCSLTSKADPNCPGKVKCPVWITGTKADGADVKPRSLNTRNWTLASQMLLEEEAGVKREAPKTLLRDAIDLFIIAKKRNTVDTQRKAKLLLGRLKAFAERLNKLHVSDIGFPDLVAFRDAWTEQPTTQRRNQEILRSFFWFCVKADYIAKSPASDLDPIKVGRPKTEPFTHEELDRIFAALECFPDEYGRRGQPIAAQTKAFVLVMRYTGMAIGDVAKLEKQHVLPNGKIMTHRKKTGEPVYGVLPTPALTALYQAPHDSERYFFWSGNGKLHTRTSKWHERLQKLFVLADVRTVDGHKQRRSGGKKKADFEPVKVSKATPHMFRHTLARDLLERGTPMEEVAELLGNDMKTVEEYYSKWDRRRQERLEKRLQDFWQNDPMTRSLNKVDVSGSESVM